MDSGANRAREVGRGRDAEADHPAREAPAGHLELGHDRELRAPGHPDFGREAESAQLLNQPLGAERTHETGVGPLWKTTNLVPFFTSMT